ncbi:MAG TPA: hypothetical protein VHZ25_00485 [Acidobacteriaceae bacterium]|jgi:hypothetical protein|nr:hypothetical protein [Acidobacteriaceae bacterium]
MRSTLHKFFLASAVAAAAALTTASAFADTSVNVPFSFTVNGKVCPAGHYSIGRNDNNGIVTLRNDDWKSSFTWLAGPGDPTPYDARVILRFDQDGGNYTLQSVQYHSLITARLDGRKLTETGPTRVVLGR